jgi:hypothetical protein
MLARNGMESQERKVNGALQQDSRLGGSGRVIIGLYR